MYCPKCGKELPEGAYFCPNCGNRIISPPSPPQTFDSPGQDISATERQVEQPNTPPAPQQNEPPVPDEEVKCPKCGAPGCAPQYKQNVSGGGYGCCQGALGSLILGPLGLLCGACGRSVKTTNNLVWICPKCGHEFRVQSKEEVKASYRAKCGLLVAYALVADIFFAYIGYDDYWGKLMESIETFIIFLSVLMAACIAFFAYIFLYKKPPVKFKDEELQQLKTFTVISLVITLAFGFAIITLF